PRTRSARSARRAERSPPVRPTLPEPPTRHAPLPEVPDSSVGRPWRVAVPSEGLEGEAFRAKRPERGAATRHGRPRQERYSTHSARNKFVSLAPCPFRFDPNTRYRPSGLNTGKPSNSGELVMRVRPVPSRPIM